MDGMILITLKMVPLILATIKENGVTRPIKYSELTYADAIQADCDIKATNIILQGLPPEKGETLRDFYLRFSLLLNDMNIYNVKLEQFEVNAKFLNTLPPEWSKFVTDVKLVRDLHTINIDQLHAYLGQHAFHANEVCLMHERNSDPLSLVTTHQMTRSPYQTHQHSCQNSQFQPHALLYQSPQFGSTYQSQQYSTKQSSTPLLITYPSNDCQSSIHHNVYSPSSSIPHVEYAPSVNQQPEFPQSDSGLIVPVFKQGNDPIDAINHMMSFLSAVVTSRYPTTNNQLGNSPNPRKQAIINDGRLEPKLYAGNVIKNTSAIVILDTKETLMLAEESHSKMLLKQQDPMESMNSSVSCPSCRPTKVEVPKELPKVSMVNTSLKKLKHHLAGFDVVVKERTTTTAITEGSWGFKHTKACFRDEIIPFVKALKDIFNTFDQYLIDELTEVQNVFHQMEQAVEQHILESKTFEVKMNQVLNENERLLEQVISKDIVNIIVNSSVDNASVNMHECKQCLKLKTKLINKKDFIEKETYDKLFRSASGSQPSGNTKKDKIQQTPSSTQKNKVEAHSRTVKSSLKNKNCVMEPNGTANVQHSKLNANSKFLCVKCNGYMLSDNHDLCVLDFINDVNARAKSKSVKKSSKRKVWKPTGKVFTNIGYTWRPTGRTFTIVGNACPLTRITTTAEMPLRKQCV
ncbi:hypothetical protein Tco_0114840 [Tanacetum coccineum]